MTPEYLKRRIPLYRPLQNFLLHKVQPNSLNMMPLSVFPIPRRVDDVEHMRKGLMDKEVTSHSFSWPWRTVLYISAQLNVLCTEGLGSWTQQ